jgi:hypothetical protein
VCERERVGKGVRERRGRGERERKRESKDTERAEDSKVGRHVLAQEWVNDLDSNECPVEEFCPMDLSLQRSD